MQRLAHNSGEDRVDYLGGQLEVGLTGHMRTFSEELFDSNDRIMQGRVLLPLHVDRYGQVGSMRFAGDGKARIYLLDAKIVPQLICPGTLPRKLQGPPAPMIVHDTVDATSISFTGCVPFYGEMSVFIGPRSVYLNVGAKADRLETGSDKVDMSDPQLAMVYRNDYRTKAVAAAVCYADDTVVAIGHDRMTWNLARSGALAVMALQPLGDHDG